MDNKPTCKEQKWARGRVLTGFTVSFVMVENLEVALLTGSCFSLHLFLLPEALQELLLQLVSDMN